MVSLKELNSAIVIAFVSAVYLLLLLLLGESSLQVITWGVGAGLCVILTHRYGSFQKIENYPPLVWGWLALVAALLVSAFFSINLPLTLHAASFYGFSLLFFWTVLLSARTEKKVVGALITLTVVCFVLVAISVIFFLMPTLTDVLPGMNILYAKHGHNHLAALLIMVLPISWWLASVREGHVLGKNTHFLIGTLPWLFSIALIGTFGRIALFIGLLQLVCMQLFLKKDGEKKSTTALIAAMVVVVLAQLLLSVGGLSNNKTDCPFPQYKKQLCKTLSGELRPSYWQQAFMVFREHPLVGSGPGTYSLAAIKYRMLSSTPSSYAHNAYAQAFSELGVVGGTIWIGLLLYLVYVSWLSAALDFKHKKLSWKTAVFIVVISSYVNAFFDFDWSFSGVFCITLGLIALLLTDITLGKKNHGAIVGKRILYAIFFSTAIVLGSLLVIYLRVENLIAKREFKQAFETFPFFNWYRIIFQETLKDQESKKALLHIYKANPEIYKSYVVKTSDKHELEMLKQNLYVLDPSQRLYSSLVPYYLEQGRWSQAEHELRQIHLLWRTQLDAEGQNTYFYLGNREKIAQEFQELADALLIQRRNDKAAEMIAMMSEINGDNYWVRAQVGHFAVRVGDLAKAEADFEECWQSFKPSPDFNHGDCEHGLKDLRSGRPNVVRYDQVSQIIRGKTGWEEFSK